MNTTMDNLPLLMTASVSTRGMKGACFSDEEREGMYVSALMFYVNHLLPQRPEQKIVFAENSGWNLDRIKKKLPQSSLERIEFVALSYDEFDITKGKGYNEMLLINQTLLQSRFIREAKAFFKVTGRYPIFNIASFLKDAERKLLIQDYALYCDMKDHNLYKMLGLNWSAHAFECRLFGVNKAYYMEHMAPLYHNCDDEKGIYIEEVLFQFVKQRTGGDKLSLRFRREPHMGGMEGSHVTVNSFTRQHDSWISKTKRYAGNIIRVCFPWWYF